MQKLQERLNSLLVPSPHLKIDGDFGERTYRAVLAFQKARHLTPDGEAGAKTLAALGIKAPTAVATPSGSFSVPWIAIAMAEKGVREDSRPGHHNGRIVEYHQSTTLRATDDETPWCSSFVNWVVRRSGRGGTNNAAARSWQNWGVAVTNPIPGAVVVIKKKTAGFSQATGSSSGFHVGFFLSISSSHIRIFGGNQGNQVKESNFPLHAYEVKAYRI